MVAMRNVEFDVASFYLPYFVYGELDGYEEKELDDLDNFCQSVEEQYGDGYFVVGDLEEETEFAYCEVTGLKANVTTITYICSE